MKPVKILTLLGVSLFLQACSSSTAHHELSEKANQPVSHFNGQLVIGSQTRVFTPCNSQIQYQIVVSAKQLKALMPHMKHPNDALSVELTGYLSVPSQTGYNADYRAILHTRNITAIKPAGVSCQTAIHSQNQPWTGRYSAQSTTSGLITTLALNPDHSARTTYTYSNERFPVIEDGFWQPINNKQVQVTMTLHQQQFLVTERVFTVRGDALFAGKEKIGNKDYAIPQGGLLLFKEQE